MWAMSQGCEQRFEVVAFLLALHGPGGVGVDGFGGPGRPVLLAAHRDTVPGRHEAPKKEPSLSQHRFWHHCGDGCAFGAGSQ